jgi:hypothetical protein
MQYANELVTVNKLGTAHAQLVLCDHSQFVWRGPKNIVRCWWERRHVCLPANKNTDNCFLCNQPIGLRSVGGYMNEKLSIYRYNRVRANRPTSGALYRGLLFNDEYWTDKQYSFIIFGIACSLPSYKISRTYNKSPLVIAVKLKAK